jgi:hypothetical protein
MTKKSELDKIIKDAGGPITAEQVVQAARNKSEFPALHQHLWEVPERELANEARLARAHKLIIALRVVSASGSITRMMVHTLGTKGYQPAEHVAANIDLASIKLKQLSADVGRARERLRGFRSMIADDLSDEIDEALERATSAIDRATARDAAA